MTERAAPKVELVSVGAEILLGETIDTNAAFLGAQLAALGLPPGGAHTVADDRALIAATFADALRRTDLVIATGGLGPTHDDVTREGLADAVGESLSEDPHLLRVLQERFAADGAMPAANRRQAMLIPSAHPLSNPIGSAPGWWVERDAVVVVLLPGVPSEMRRMWTDEVAPRLASRFRPAGLAMRTVKAFGIGESAMAERLRDLLESPPVGVDTGIYARDDGVHLRFSTRGDDRPLNECVARAMAALGEDAYGTDADDLPTAALVRLGGLGIRTVASRESGTHGALLAVLAEAGPNDAGARFVGGALEAGGEVAHPSADVLVEVTLLPEDAHGRSRVRVAVTGQVRLDATEVRIHGSGPQRLRRSAFAALDVVRRLSSSGR